MLPATSLVDSTICTNRKCVVLRNNEITVRADLNRKLNGLIPLHHTYAGMQHETFSIDGHFAATVKRISKRCKIDTDA